MRLGDHMMLIQLQLSTVQISRYSQTPRSPSPTRNSNNSSNNTNNSSTSSSSNSSSNQCPCRPPSLMQASRNLQHTLRRLSADVLSGLFIKKRTFTLFDYLK